MVAIQGRRGLCTRKHTRPWRCTRPAMLERMQAAVPAEGDVAAPAPSRLMKCWQTGWLEANTVLEEAQQAEQPAEEELFVALEAELEAAVVAAVAVAASIDSRCRAGPESTTIVEV